MREGVSGAIVAVAAVLCCALPFLIISGVLVTADGFALSQMILLGVGNLIVILAGLSWVVLKRKNKMNGEKHCPSAGESHRSEPARGSLYERSDN